MLDPSSVSALDSELARAAGLGVRGRLQLGELLVRLGDRYRELGFRTFGGYVRERLSLGARWCADARRLAERLRERGAIREALLSRRIGWSMAELLRALPMRRALSRSPPAVSRENASATTDPRAGTCD